MINGDEEELAQTRELKDIYDAQRLAIRQEDERRLQERDDEIADLERRIAVAQSIRKNKKPLNYLQNYPRRCRRIATWCVVLLIGLVVGYVGGSKMGGDTGHSEGVHEGSRIAARVSIREPGVWHKFVHEVLSAHPDR